jgi:hypothetical protein
VTTNDDDHRARGRVLLNAAMNNRSRGRRCERPTWRFRTISWWRRTTTSTSVVISSLEEPTIERTTRRSKRYTRAKSTTEPPREGGQILRTPCSRRRSVVCVPFRLR